MEQWQDDRPVITWPDGHATRGSGARPEEMAKVLRSISDGSRYEGQFRNDMQNGHGFFTWPSGQRYDGQMANLTAKAFILGLMVNATRGNGAMTKKADKGL